MFDRGTPPVINPVNVALVIRVVGAVVTKSSADSIWELGARAAVAIRPSGLPVLKENVPALAVPAIMHADSAAVANQNLAFIRCPFRSEVQRNDTATVRVGRPGVSGLHSLGRRIARNGRELDSRKEKSPRVRGTGTKLKIT
jgi:hypothetical protein